MRTQLNVTFVHSYANESDLLSRYHDNNQTFINIFLHKCTNMYMPHIYAHDEACYFVKTSGRVIFMSIHKYVHKYVHIYVHTECMQ